MIYCDPTEVREGTRLPPEIVACAIPVVGLEAMTGADLLISRPGLEGKDVTKMPWKMKLKECLQDGMLIQRKSGMDLVNSVPHLSSIFQRMQLATEGTNCWVWLMYVGQFATTQNGKVMVENRATEWNWNALQGALDMWQLRGGYLHHELTDMRSAEWLIRWEGNLPKLAQDLEKTLGPRAKSRLEGGRIDPKPWRMTLESFPGVGSEMSYRIAERAGKLADALVWMTWDTGPKLEGVGKATVEKWRAWFGLEEGEFLVKARDEPPTIRTKEEADVLKEMQRRLLND